MGSSDEELEVRITIGENEYFVQEKIIGRTTILLSYTEKLGNTSARIHFHKISGHTPYIFEIKVRLVEGK